MPEPLQIAVLYDDFPHIDAAQLRSDINSMEPEAEPSEAPEFRMEGRESGSVLMGLVSQAGLHATVQVLAEALPEQTARVTIGAAPMPTDTRNRLKAHRVHALCTCLGADGKHPVEGFVLLLKVAAALCRQGAIGVANPGNCTCFPAELMQSLSEGDLAGVGPVEGVHFEAEFKGGPVWETLRTEGVPGAFLVGMISAQIAGQLYFLSSGHALFGFPELAYAAADLSEYEEIDGHFKNVFYYMFEHGPVLEPGQTMGYDESAAIRFDLPGAELEPVRGEYGTLVLSFVQTS